MTRTLTLLAAMLPLSVFAQITLTQSGYPTSVLGTDSLKVTTAASAFPALSASANGTWDLSSVTDSTPTFFACRVHGIAGYLFADSDLFHIGSFAYQGNVQSNISVSEINEYGVNIPRRIYSLYVFTANPDSLVIDSQTVTYSSPRTKIAFPCTYNTVWSSSYVSDLGIHLTFLVNGDTSAPGYIRTYTTEKDSVTGWGRMRVRDASGMPSDYLNVLQLQTRITHTDSFFLKGVPFNGSLLSILGVTQGQKDTVYEQNYYRGGELTPLAQVEFRDAAYTQPYKATTHVQRLSAVAVPGIVSEKDVRVYPNPAPGSTIMVELPHAGGSWSYTIADVNGRRRGEGMLEKAGSGYTAKLPSTVIAGLYELLITGEHGEIFSRAIEIR